MRTIEQVVSRLPRPRVAELPAPPYTGTSSVGVGLAVESMSRHMTDEGWRLFTGLEAAGWTLAGHNITTKSYAGEKWVQTRQSMTDVREILDFVRPGICCTQDPREWDVPAGDFRDPHARFKHLGVLRERPDVLSTMPLKDAHQRPEYHRKWMEDAGVHAVVTYYHPRIVCHLAPYVRPRHVVRTYHCVNAADVPPYAADGRNGCILSGALGPAYPLRQELVRGLSKLKDTVHLKHPGYHRRGCNTPEFLKTLSRYKVAICTSSIYGYALRKLVEASACGCVVLTDLPTDDVMPEIDGNFVRLHPAWSSRHINTIIQEQIAKYDPEKQRHYAEKAKAFYSVNAVGLRLAEDIEQMRRSYS